MTNGKVSVNGSSSGNDPNIQSQITAALLQNGGVKRIENTLKQRLDEEGWSERMRNYIEHLFRSGEAVTFDDAWAKLMPLVNDAPGTANGANGTSAPDIKIPQSAKDDGAEIVKKELTAIVVMDK